MIAMFGTENLEDDTLTDEENEVVQPGLPAQPAKKNRNAFRSAEAKRNKMLKDVGREAKILINMAWKTTGEILVELPQCILFEVLSLQ
jgi:hypothetical protein